MADCDDPLRFLKLKKKRQQNRKHTPVKSSSSQSLSQTSHFIMPSFTSLNSIEQHHKISYNPLKYFSQQIEDFLNTQKQSQKQMTFAKDKHKMKDFQKQDNKLTMMTFSRQNKRRLFEDEQEEEENNFFKANQLENKFKKNLDTVKEKQRQDKITIEEFKVDDHVGQNEEEYGYQNQILKQCEICGRKFNPDSYEKHVRVCDKVFMQKRKPFRSRSTSLEANAKRRN